jgi:hypothetical protein
MMGRLRFRVYVGGHIAVEDWLPTSPDGEIGPDGAELAKAHRAVCDQAEAEGKRWLVELYDPSEPEEDAYMRFGTDTGGMVLPIAVIGFGDLLSDN